MHNILKLAINTVISFTFFIHIHIKVKASKCDKKAFNKIHPNSTVINVRTTHLTYSIITSWNNHNLGRNPYNVICCNDLLVRTSMVWHPLASLTYFSILDIPKDLTCAINVSTSSTVLSPTSLGQLQIISIVFYHTVQIKLLLVWITRVLLQPLSM